MPRRCQASLSDEHSDVRRRRGRSRGPWQALLLCRSPPDNVRTCRILRGFAPANLTDEGVRSLSPVSGHRGAELLRERNPVDIVPPTRTRTDGVVLQVGGGLPPCDRRSAKQVAGRPTSPVIVASSRTTGSSHSRVSLGSASLGSAHHSQHTTVSTPLHPALRRARQRPSACLPSRTFRTVDGASRTPCPNRAEHLRGLYSATMKKGTAGSHDCGTVRPEIG